MFKKLEDGSLHITFSANQSRGEEGEPLGNLVAPSVKNFQHSLMTVGQPLSPEGSLKIAQDQDVQKSLEHSSTFSLGSLGNPSSREVECDQSLGNPVSDKAPSTAHIFEQICQPRKIQMILDIVIRKKVMTWKTPSSAPTTTTIWKLR